MVETGFYALDVGAFFGVVDLGGVKFSGGPRTLGCIIPACVGVRVSPTLGVFSGKDVENGIGMIGASMWAGNRDG